LTLKLIIDKVKRVFPKIGLLLKLKGTLDNSKKAQMKAWAIPEKYDLKAIDAWQKKFMKYFE
jgi:hypothetical protein